ncbi:MAG: hypothetical protein ACKVOI_08365 [Dongiaceae bacterium]
MSHSSRDPAVEAAQNEIRRRLLRQEKLKRIEGDERRHLAAMGWQPPRGGPAARRGASVHDAAAAIELTEQKRRTPAQKAQRRADARQNDPLAMRDKSEVRRRAEDRTALAQHLDRVPAMLAQVENVWREH